MVTIKDVAKMAGVSVATVSRVLNNSAAVTAETMETVNRVIEKLNYQPNLLGRKLRRMETKTILVLLPSIANPFYSRVVKGIEDVGQKNGYNVMLCNTDSDKHREKQYLELLKNRLSDGVIFMEPELTTEELTALGKEYPIVQCSEYREGTNVPFVSIDNEAAAHDAVKHLIGLRHKRIGMISCENTVLSTRQREVGYREALHNAGIDYDPSIVVYGDYSFKSGLRAAKRLIDMDDKPTAIFVISDIMAIGAMAAIKQRGLIIPEDMAVVGFDNISFSTMCDPLLTTISQPKYDLGCTAMNMLLKKMHGNLNEPTSIILEHELKIRGSTV